ncbi:MAG: class I SAM-dependent methyltransferase [Actinomycetota bacterium]|nr:MAG: class I SAM-dependent methyltransferase [Actinomycetota bacterium]
MDQTLQPQLASELLAKQELIRATKGFMPPDEGAALAAALKGCDVSMDLPAVEIGSYTGLSTIYLGTAAQLQGRLLLSVDHHHGSQENQAGWEYHDPSLIDPVSGKMDTLYLFRRAMELAGLDDTVIIVVANSQSFAATFCTEIGFLFIDGGHGHDQAYSDYDSWVPKLAESGVLAIHDVFADPSLGGQAPYHLYQRSLGEGFQEIGAQGSLRVMRKGSA